ncbi:MAG: HD domain-containing protein [Candidatus Micrarchaeota archaeon]
MEEAVINKLYEMTGKSGSYREKYSSIFNNLEVNNKTYMLGEEDTSRIVKAAKLAYDSHQDTRRKYDTFVAGKAVRLPYFDHVLSVALNTSEKTSSANAVIAAFLHDTVEHGKLTIAQIKKGFGMDVAEIVGLVTHPKVKIILGGMTEYIYPADPRYATTRDSFKNLSPEDFRLNYKRHVESHRKISKYALPERGGSSAGYIDPEKWRVASAAFIVKYADIVSDLVELTDIGHGSARDKIARIGKFESFMRIHIKFNKWARDPGLCKQFEYFDFNEYRPLYTAYMRNLLVQVKPMGLWEKIKLFNFARSKLPLRILAKGSRRYFRPKGGFNETNSA